MGVAPGDKTHKTPDSRIFVVLFLDIFMSLVVTGRALELKPQLMSVPDVGHLGVAQVLWQRSEDVLAWTVGPPVQNQARPTSGSKVVATYSCQIKMFRVKIIFEYLIQSLGAEWTETVDRDRVDSMSTTPAVLRKLRMYN